MNRFRPGYPLGWVYSIFLIPRQQHHCTADLDGTTQITQNSTNRYCHTVTPLRTGEETWRMQALRALCRYFLNHLFMGVCLDGVYCSFPANSTQNSLLLSRFTFLLIFTSPNLVCDVGAFVSSGQRSSASCSLRGFAASDVTILLCATLRSCFVNQYEVVKRAKSCDECTRLWQIRPFTT